MNKKLEALMERVGTWPEEVQDEAAHALAAIEEKHIGIRRPLTPEEEAKLAALRETINVPSSAVAATRTKKWRPASLRALMLGSANGMPHSGKTPQRSRQDRPRFHCGIYRRPERKPRGCRTICARASWKVP